MFFGGGQVLGSRKYVRSPLIRSYTRIIRHLVDIGAPAEKEVIQ